MEKSRIFTLVEFPFFLTLTAPAPPRLQPQSASLPLSKRRLPFGEREHSAIWFGLRQLRLLLLLMMVYIIIPLGLEEAGSGLKTLHGARIDESLTNIELRTLVAIGHRIVDHP